MKIRYDKKVDAVYIELARGKYAHSRKVSPGVLVDHDEAGNVLGIEIIEATKNIPEFDPDNIKLQTQAL